MGAGTESGVDQAALAEPETEVELLVLLDRDGQPCGTTPKSTVHRTVAEGRTPLHLAFSCHIVDAQDRPLLTRRALGKVAWTNAVCGHPGPGEDGEAAIRRRARQELGLGLGQVWSALPDFAYRATDAAGMEESEVCPVCVALHCSRNRTCTLKRLTITPGWSRRRWGVGFGPPRSPSARDGRRRSPTAGACLLDVWGYGVMLGWCRRSLVPVPAS